MKFPLKILLGIVGLAVVLAVGLALTVALLFDPKDYQPLLAESVEKATGRRLTLEGDLGLDLFPCCSVTLGRSSLGNPPGFPPGEFASVASASLSIRLWPLITQRDIEIGVVRLHKLNAALLARADGSANWEFDGAGAAESTAGGEAEESGDLAIAGIEIHEGRIAYRDEQDASGYLAENIELETGDIAGGRPFDFKASAKITEEAKGSAATVAIAATATLDPATSRLTLARPLVDVTASGKSFPAQRLTARLGAAELAIESAPDIRLRFSGLEGEFAMSGLRSLAGDLEGKFVAGDASFAVGGSTELLLPKLSAEFIVSGKGVPGDIISATLQASGLALDIDKMLGSIQAMTADINGLGARLLVTGAGRVRDSGANMAGTIKLDPVSPRSLLAVLQEPEPKTADPKALTRLEGSADWALAQDSLRLPKLDFQLDQTGIAGSLGISKFDKPVTSFDLRLDAIDLDRYLEPPSEGDGASSRRERADGDAEADGDPSRSERTDGAAADDIPVDSIRELRLDGRVQIGQLVFAKAKIADMSAGVHAANGKLRLDPVTAKLYGGEYRGAIAVDVSGPKARVALDQQVTALQVGGVLKDLYQTDKLTGALTGRIDATGAGNSSDAIIRTLAGNIALNLADGAYLGTDLWHEIRAARARLKGDAPPPVPANPQTKLQAMEIAGKITDGVLRTDKLLAEIPFIRMTGAGALDLVGRSMDYRMQAQVFETPTFEDGTSIKDITGLTIPLTLRGPMDGPKVGVELKGLATGVATQKLRDRLFKKLGGDEPEPDGAATGSTGEPAQPGEQPATGEQAPKEEKPRDALKRTLRDLLKPSQ